MISRSVSAIPFAILWLMLSGYVSIVNFVFGFVMGWIMLRIFLPNVPPVSLRRLPMQVIWGFYYFGWVLIDVVLSSFQVAYYILRPRQLPEAGIVPVLTQDETRDPVISAMSAHSITITPGELVADFDEDDEEGIVMYVHSLDVEKTTAERNERQHRRLELIKRVLGRD